MSAGQVY